MDRSFYRGNRRRLLQALPADEPCIVLLSSGYEVCRSADENYDFQVNENFYYLTGITQPEVQLLLLRDGDNFSEFLFTAPYSEFHEKWLGHLLTKKEASAICGVPQKYVAYTDDFDGVFAALKEKYKVLYLDLEVGDTPEYRSFGLAMRDKYAGDEALAVRSIYEEIIALRCAKQPCEVETMRVAVANTGRAIAEIVAHLRPGMYEYQAEAWFDHSLKDAGNKKLSFKTIAAAGINATTLHYSSNNCLCNDGDLILFDLGCREAEYCADITRTFPVNGKFTPLQRTIYDIVLRANKKIIAVAHAGMTVSELQAVCVKELTDGCLKAGLIKKPEEIRKYYFHGVSHSIGLDTHDPHDRKAPLPVGAVISDEPGLYFPEYGIGVRIEDDLLLRKGSAVNLSASIPKEIDEIEAMFQK